jgi:predicted nucleotidyltransferase
MQEWQEYKQLVKEVEEFQKKMAALNNRSKRRLLTKGRQSNTSPYVKKPSLKRSKSAPPGFGAIGEDVAIVPELHDELNAEIWTEDNKLRPELAERLLRIAKDFYEKLDLPTPILDITFTGSMANYNWTSQSDIDLHIVIDYNDVNEDLELVKNYLMEAKSNWNRNHEIMMKGHEVEIYVQDSSEPHHSTAVYSILNDEWEIVPEKADFEVSEDAIHQKND